MAGAGGDARLGEELLVVPEADHADVVGHRVGPAAEPVGLQRDRELDDQPNTSVRSSISPASACCCSTPPPQVWKTSGSLPEEVAAVSFDLNASFSSEVVWITISGWAVVNAAEIRGKRDRPVPSWRCSTTRRTPCRRPSSRLRIRWFRRPRSWWRTGRSGPRAPGDFVGSGGCWPWDLRGGECRFVPENFSKYSRIPRCHKLGTQGLPVKTSHSSLFEITVVESLDSASGQPETHRKFAIHVVGRGHPHRERS